jgi:hypothetical protein
MSAIPIFSATTPARERPVQNWILDPLQDGLFVIAAPLLVLALALFAFARLDAAVATSLIITTHIVMTVAHHLPTFIRIYGDVDLFKRFKWNFLLAPVIPIGFSIAVLTYINAHGYPVEYFLYLYILLAIWDPWHFLRQHYGFMRIYDRPSTAPRGLAAKMDLWLCVTWFVFVMLASGAWLPDLLRDFHVSANMPIVLLVSRNAIQILTRIAGAAALAMTAAYCLHLYRTWRRGHFISFAKLALFVVTFGVMYLTYTPNAWIAKLAPGWTFKVGIVHMTQYLAIVWRYNRSLARSPARSRRGIFKWWHADRRWQVIAILGAIYVGVCLLYGDVLTTKHENRLLMSALLAIGFTSTLLHYYFDGFIWKIRHEQNHSALAPSSIGGEKSWWHAAKLSRPGRMLLRQALYFGVPMAVLTIGAASAWSVPASDYIEHMYRAQALSQQSEGARAENEARLAYADMNRQLPLASKMVELEPTAAREAELAFLVYNQSMYQHIIMPQLARRPVTPDLIAEHRENISRAIELMESAINQSGSLAHPHREEFTREQAANVSSSWKRLVQ